MSKTAFVFPGQGSQYVGMGKVVYEKSQAAREVFEETNEILGFDLAKMCFEGNINELTRTENTQPALLTVSTAMLKVFTLETGIEPAYCAGHSLGEITALTCAGAIRFADAVRIVRKRGLYMQEAVPQGQGAMSAVTGIGIPIVEEECKKFNSEENTVVVSNYNSPDQIVVSGHAGAIKSLGERLIKLGASVIPLKVSAPFHSPLMKSAAENLRRELDNYEFNDLKYSVISNVNALPYPGRESISENLSLQVVKPVRWVQSMEYLALQGVNTVVEIGPKEVLKKLVKKNTPGILAFSYDVKEDEKALIQRFSPIDAHVMIDKKAKLKLITRCIAITVCTKNRNWDNEEYNKGVVEPYRKVQKMLEILEAEDKEPTMEQMKEALDMLKSVFKTKQTPVDEQIERFSQVFNETGTHGLFPNFEMPCA